MISIIAVLLFNSIRYGIVLLSTHIRKVIILWGKTGIKTNLISYETKTKR